MAQDIGAPEALKGVEMWLTRPHALESEFPHTPVAMAQKWLPTARDPPTALVPEARGSRRAPLPLGSLPRLPRRALLLLTIRPRGPGGPACALSHS